MAELKCQLSLLATVSYKSYVTDTHTFTHSHKHTLIHKQTLDCVHKSQLRHRHTVQSVCRGKYRKKRNEKKNNTHTNTSIVTHIQTYRRPHRCLADCLSVIINEINFLLFMKEAGVLCVCVWACLLQTYAIYACVALCNCSLLSMHCVLVCVSCLDNEGLVGGESSCICVYGF